MSWSACFDKLDIGRVQLADQRALLEPLEQAGVEFLIRRDVAA